MIIGLTGGIASGKSTVTSYLKEKGFPIVDADLVSRDVVKPGTLGLKKIVDRFTKKVLNSDSSLNRKVLRAIIFNDEEARLDLNSILHPIIHDEIIRQIEEYKKHYDVIIFDAPLLLENQLQDMVDQVWVVSTDSETQIERLMKRDGINKDEANAIIKRQMPIEEKVKLADVVIYNNSDLISLYKQIENAL